MKFVSDIIKTIEADEQDKVYSELFKVNTSTQLFAAIKLTEYVTHSDNKRFTNFGSTLSDKFGRFTGRSSSLIIHLARDLANAKTMNEIYNLIDRAIESINTEDKQYFIIFQNLLNLLPDLMKLNANSPAESVAKSFFATAKTAIHYLEHEQILDEQVEELKSVFDDLQQAIERAIVESETQEMLKRINKYYDSTNFDLYLSRQSSSRKTSASIIRLAAHLIAQVEGEYGYFKFLDIKPTAKNLADKIMPCVYALTEIQRILNELAGEPSEESILVHSIEQGSVAVKVYSSVKDAINLVRNYLPRKVAAEAEAVELSNKRQEIENEIYTDFARQRESIELRKQIVALHEKEWDLYTKKMTYYLQMAREHIIEKYPDLNPRDQINYETSLAKQLQQVYESTSLPMIGWREPPPSTLPEE